MKTRRCRHKVRKSCGAKKLLKKDCRAEMNAKCKVEGIKIHDPEMCSDPNTADYCPCCMDDAHLDDSVTLEEEEEPEMATCDKESTDAFEQKFSCGGGLNGHQEIVLGAAPMTQFALDYGGRFGRGGTATLTSWYWR